MYEYSSLVPDPAPQRNPLRGLSFIADFIECHSVTAKDSNQTLSLIGSAQEVQRLLEPFKTNTPADDHWVVEQHQLEKAVDDYLHGKHRADTLKRRQYARHGDTLIHANEHDFLRELKSIMRNDMLSEEQQANVEKALKEVCPPLSGHKR